jgi:hypothetical protein
MVGMKSMKRKGGLEGAEGVAVGDGRMGEQFRFLAWMRRGWIYGGRQVGARL